MSDPVRRIKHFLFAFGDSLSKVLWLICTVCLVAITALIFVQVVTRYALGWTPFWSEETALLLMVWFGLIGAGLGWSRNAHLRVEFVVRALPKKLAFLAGAIEILAVGGFGLFLLIAGGRLASFTFQSSQTLPATKLPAGVEYLALPTAGAILVAATARRTWTAIRSRYTRRDEEAED